MRYLCNKDKNKMNRFFILAKNNTCFCIFAIIIKKFI
jgi:hypothetical protein